MNTKKIFIVTGSRAEFGLLKPLILRFNETANIEFKLVVTGSHLSKKFGETVTEIYDDNIKIDFKIKIDLSKNDEYGVSKSISSGLDQFSLLLEKNKPDLVIILGDRYEIFSCAVACTIFKIPIAHFNGGELTSGAYDESFRHSITKMSHIHFVSSNEYRNRVIQLGENPKTVFNVGALSIEAIVNLELFSKNELQSILGLDLNKDSFVVTYHPETLSKIPPHKQITTIFDSLLDFPEVNFIFTKANADTNSHMINKLIDDFSQVNRNVYSFSSLGVKKYISLLKYVRGVIGNSSSGIIEVPYFNIGTINIGNRQDGRLRVRSIIDCKRDRKEISRSIRILMERDYSNVSDEIKEIYGSGNVSSQAVEIICQSNLDKLLQKKFYDMPQPNK